MNQRSIAISCGGTGGHIFPGLATALVLKQRGHRVSLWLAGKNIESVSVAAWDGSIITVPARGFSFGVSPKSVVALFKLLGAIRLCMRHMRHTRPDVLLAMGSYSSVGPVLAARACGVPVVLHESNLIPGRAVSFLARHARHVAIHFPETAGYLRTADTVVTGMPLRREITADRAWSFSAEAPFTVLVMGGSQGAHYLNQVCVASLAALHRSGESIRSIHLAGLTEEAAVREAYRAAGVPATVHGFLADMPSAYLNADIAICRSGAASCAELAAYGLPALLVPYPQAARDHQAANAEAMQTAGASDFIRQEKLTESWLTDYLRTIRRDTGRRAAMHDAGRRYAIPDGVRKLADLVESTSEVVPAQFTKARRM